MKKILKITSLLLALLMCFTLSACEKKDAAAVIEKEVNTTAGSGNGYTVILHSNDVHGAVEGYSYMAGLKTYYESLGYTVIMVDDGDFTNGNIYVSLSQGESAVELMNLAGYDIVALGNHELDFGYDKLKENVAKGKFTTICSNVTKDGSTIFDSEVVVKVGTLKIGFFALLTPETQTKVNPANIQGLVFTEKEDLYKAAQDEVDKLKDEADIIVCLSHLGVDAESEGNRSTDVLENVTGIDFVIDGHSHTVMEKGDNGEAIQSTGTQFENVGIIIVNNETKEITENKLLATADLEDEMDANVLAAAQNLEATVDDEFGAKFAETKVALEGTKAIVRSQETNLGNLITDAMVWSATNEATLEVDADHVVCVTNGGGIRASVEAGDVSRSIIKTVLPFGNTIAVNYVTGAELLEALEASTYACPDSLGGFPQISGMKIVIDTTVEYDAGEEYPDSTYCAPNSIKRVTITEVNGKEFNEADTYAVVTNNFCAAGGDTYYSFKRAYDAGNGFDTSIPMDEAVVNFIQYQLAGVIDETYANPEGRITIK